MIHTDEGTAVARCPRCGSHDRVSVVAPPKHNPDARFLCGSVLVFTGSTREAQAEADAREASGPRAVGSMCRRGWIKRRTDWTEVPRSARMVIGDVFDCLAATPGWVRGP